MLHGRCDSVRWLGHASFLLKSPGGVSIVTDPFGSDVPYPGISVEAQVVTVSHEHYDHNKVDVVRGKPRVLRGVNPATGRFQPIKETVGDVTFETLPSFHDDASGKKRGENAIFIVTFPSMKVVHLGDLGHPLSKEILDRLGKVDVLLIPVGGYYTIDGVTARDVVRSISPRVAIPMHYKTKYTSNWPIQDEKSFLEGFQNVKMHSGSEVEIEPSKLPEKLEIWVLSI